MKIAHVCLAGAYTEEMGYQDNLLVGINRDEGHQVLVVSDCKRFQDGKIVATLPEDRIMANGARLVRLSFDWMGPRYLTDKIRRTRKLFPLLESFRPDVILYHGVVGWELLTLARYKRMSPGVKIYLDSHEDRHNSATNWLSYFFQYRIFIRWLAHRVLPHVEKILYISAETKDFLTEVLDLPESCLEYYPLGGLVVPNSRRAAIRKIERAKLGLADDQVVFLHSGKIDKRKRTLEILAAFLSVPSNDARLVLVGSLEGEAVSAIEAAMGRDPRVLYLGWKTSEGLNNIMCMADFYVQPGGQSASLQHAICCGLPVMVFPYPSHKLMVQANGYFVSSQADMALRMSQIVADPQVISAMRKASYAIAKNLLDYRKLAQRLYR